MDFLTDKCIKDGVLTIPKNLVTFDKEVAEFIKGKDVKEIRFEEGSHLEVVKNGALKSNDDILKLDFSNCKNLKTIEAEAFAYCDNLKSVNLNGCENLESIGEMAFRVCLGLESVDFGHCDKLTQIETAVFENCKSLKSVDFSNLKNFKTIGAYAFGHCFALENVKFPQNDLPLEINEWSFVSCQQLNEIDLSNRHIKKLKPSCFTNCQNLKVYNLQNCVIDEFFHIWNGVKPDVLDLRGTKNIGVFLPFHLNVRKVMLDYDLMGAYSSRSFDEAFEYGATVELYNGNKKVEEFKPNDEVYGGYYVNNIGLLKYARSKGYDLSSDFLCALYNKSDLDVVFKNFESLTNLVHKKLLKGIYDRKQVKNALMLLRMLGYFGVSCPINAKDDVKREIGVYKNLLAKDLIKCKLINDMRSDLNRDYINRLIQEKTNKIARNYPIEKLVEAFIDNHITNSDKRVGLIDLFERITVRPNINLKLAEFLVYNFDEIMEKKMGSSVNKEFNKDFDNVEDNKISLFSIILNFKEILSNSNKQVLTRSNNQRLTLADCEYGNLYTNICDGNEKLAELCGKAHLKQQDFEELQNYFNKGKVIKSVQILKVGEDLNNEQVRYEFINKDNPIGLVLGNITNCCQRIHGAGQDCMIIGATDPSSGFATINYNGKIIAQTWIWYDYKTKTIALDNIEVPEVYEKLVNKDLQNDVAACIDRLCDNLFYQMRMSGHQVENVIIGKANTDIESLCKDYYLENDKNKLINCNIKLDGEEVYSDVSKNGQYVIYRNEKRVPFSREYIGEQFFTDSL